MHDKRMHLKDVNGVEVSISVDLVGTMKELLEGEDPCRGSPKPHMVLCPGDERRIKGMMLTGWMGEADLLKGWASQGKKKNPSAPEAGEKGPGKGGNLQAPQGEDQRAGDAHLCTVQQERTKYLDRVRGGSNPRPEGRPSPPIGDYGGREPKNELRLV